MKINFLKLITNEPPICKGGYNKVNKLCQDGSKSLQDKKPILLLVKNN